MIEASKVTHDLAITVALSYCQARSWAWSVSLNLKTPEAMAMLEPVSGEPRQVRIDIDGIYITAIIEEWGENRQLGSRTYTASGRSTLALLSDPYAPLRSYSEATDTTAAQLIDRELLYSGWTASYHPALAQLFTTDWLVPGGAWSYQNMAPISAITTIAKAVGARAYADKNLPIVHIDPLYTVSPWDWATATPDKYIPLNLPRTINTQLRPKPIYNHVYVSGETQGVLVSATRSGTAGDRPAPMVTDRLITFVGAGTEAARNILADTGRQASVTFDMPLNTTTGLMEPGQLVQVQESVPWRGLVTGVDVSAQMGVISQSVTVERHYT